MKLKSFDIEKIKDGLSSIVNVMVTTSAPNLSKKNAKLIEELAEKYDCETDCLYTTERIFSRKGTLFGKLSSAIVKFRNELAMDEDNKGFKLPINPVTKAIEVPATQLERKLEIRDKYIGPDGEYTMLKDKLRKIFPELKEASKERLGKLGLEHDWDSFTESRFVDGYNAQMHWYESNYAIKSARDKALTQEVADIVTARQEESLVSMAKGSVSTMLSGMVDELKKSVANMGSDRVNQLAFDRFSRAHNALSTKAKSFFNKGDIEQLDDLMNDLLEVGNMKRSDLVTENDKKNAASKMERVLEAQSDLMADLGI